MKKGKIIVGIMLLAGLALCGCTSKPEEQSEYAKMILKVNDKLYYGTEETGPMGDSGCVEGCIISSVEPGEIPEENGVSNFGSVGNPYTFDYGTNAIMVFVGDETEGEYRWFRAEQ